MINNNDCKNYKNLCLLCFARLSESCDTCHIFKKMAANVPQNGGNYVPAHVSGVGSAVGVGEGHNPEQVSFIIV